MNKTLINWSGGKDSALALWRLQQTNDYAVDTLLTALNAANRRISMHGIREELLDRAFVADLPVNVDPCGENGEFHTFVVKAPYFKAPIDAKIGETATKTYRYKTD